MAFDLKGARSYRGSWENAGFPSRNKDCVRTEMGHNQDVPVGRENLDLNGSSRSYHYRKSSEVLIT